MNSISSPTELVLCIRLHYTVKYYYFKENELKRNCVGEGDWELPQKFKRGKRHLGCSTLEVLSLKIYIEKSLKNIC